MIQTHIPSRYPIGRDHSARVSLLCLLSGSAALCVLAPGALALDPVFTLVNQQVGINAVNVPVSRYSGQHDRMCGGVSVGDFNNDSWPDLFIPGLGTVPDMLYINQGNGTFADEAAAWGIDRLEMGMGSAVGDVNGDGYPDLYVVSFGPADAQAMPGKCLLYMNNGPDANGQWSFSEEGTQRGVNDVMQIVAGKGAAFGDMDLDGDLDLYVATWQYLQGGGGNRVFENDGSGHFANVSSTTLPQTDEVLRGFTPKFVDVTGDRYPDLLLTCDFTTSHLFVNNGPDASGKVSFRDTTEESGITTDHNGMGSTLADFNGDGLLDWFQTNIYVSSASYYNTLFMGTGVNENGNPTFSDEAVERGVQNEGWGWGVVSGDYDNDGDSDMVATNGWPLWPSATTPYWRNDGSGHFSDISFIVGLSFNINGKGLVQFDYDKDGDLDLAFVDNGGPFRIYRNDLGFDAFTHYLRVDLNTDHHPCLAPMGYGTRVIATYAGQDHLRVVDGASSYLGQSELTLHFGLELLDSVDSLRIEWADGSVTTMTDVPADQQITVYAYHPLDRNQDGTINFFDVSDMIGAYMTGSNSADFNGDGAIDFFDISAFIQRYASPCP